MTERNVKITLRGNIADFQAKMVAAGKSVSATVDKMTSAEKESKKFREGLSTVGDTAGKIGLVAAAGLGAVVATTANFDSAMSRVRAATHETTGNMEALRQAAIKAGADTAFSASEAADGIEALAKAGVSTRDVLGGGLQGALDLAAAGTIEVGDAAEAAATAMTQFGLSGSDVPHIADLLAAAAGKAQGEVSDMNYALSQSGLVAHQVGLSIEETTGGLAAFASAGLLGSDAGTSFKAMLGALTPNSAKAAKTMDSLGISAYDAQGNFIGLAKFAGVLHDALKDMSAEQRQARLETIFGSDAVRAASVLYDQGADGIQGWIDKVDDSGYAAETAAIKLDNLKGDLEQFKGSLETALINTGESSQGPLRKLTQSATEAVNAYNDLPDAANNAVTGLLAVTAVTGGSLWFGAKVIQGVSNTRAALDNLGSAGVRTGRMLRGALTGVAIMEGLNLLDQTLDSIFDRDLDTSKLGRSLEALSTGTVTGELLDKFGSDLSDFGEQADLATSHWTALSRALNDVPLVGGFAAGKAGDAVTNIQKLDEALAQMVESGEQDKAAAIFDRLTAAATKSGVSVDKVTGLFEQYQVAVDNANGSVGVGKYLLDPLASVLGNVDSAARGAESGIAGMAGAMDGAKTKALGLTDAMDRLFGKAIDADAAAVAWRRGIQGLTKSLKGGKDALDIFTKKGQDNRDTIRGQVESLRTWAEAQYNVDGSTKKLKDRLLEGREAILKAGEAAGISKRDMEKYLHTLGLTPKQIRTDVNLMNVNDAIDKVATLRSIYAGLPKRIVTDVITNHVDKFDRMTKADGGYISGPGTATSDSIPAMLSNGEYVVKAAAVDKYGVDFLHRVNAMRFADGGYAHRSRAERVQTLRQSSGAGVASFSVDYDRLAAAMEKARPLYGDVHVQGDGSFRRELEADRQRAALGGGWS